MLGLALLLAVASVFLARSWIQDRMQPVASVQDKPVETTKVVVAASQLHFGNKIRREHLREVDWPTAAVPEGSFKSVDDILGKKKAAKKGPGEAEAGSNEKGKEIRPRVVLRTIEVNEPILKSKITGFGGRASLSTLIAPGMRATTIRVNDITGVAGFVLPGDRVDILLTRDPASSGKSRRGGNLQTDVFLQNMKVLAIAQDANEDRNKPTVVKAVTLEVTPIQGQKLTLAQKLGSLSLSLRHVNTVDAIAPRSIKARDLRIGEANLAPDPKGGQVKATGGGETTLIVGPQVTEKRKTVVTKTVTKKTRKNLSSIKIVRGLKATEYDVTPEKPTFSAPAYSKPLNLLPSKLAPIGGPIARAAAPVPLAPSPLAPKSLTPMVPKLLTPMAPGKLAPAGDEPAKAGTEGDGRTALDSDSKILPNTEPISLLKGGGRLGEDG
jgi:pilus assembly protein CpaB